MEDLTDEQRLDRFARKYAHDGCEVRKSGASHTTA